MQNAKRPLVSIVTPSFNQAAFLPGTLESVLSQDYEHLELIVMDGGSTDGSVAILEAIHDPRLTWVSEPDRGQSHALNKGMARARGDILTYLNSDDLLTPHTVTFIVDYFEAHPEADLVTGDCQFISSEDCPVRVVKGQLFNLPSVLEGAGFILQPGTFWRRCVYERLGEFDQSLHYTMDLDYWLRAACTGFQIDYVPGVRSAFRLHETSKTVSQSPAFWRDWRMMLQNLFERSDLPASALDARAAAFAYVDWHDAKMAWVQKDYTTARPMLRRFLRDRKWVRRGLAAPMLLDSYLGTPFTRWLTGGYQHLRGVDLLAP